MDTPSLASLSALFSSHALWWPTALVLAGIALGASLLLGFAAVRFRVEGEPLVEQIDALLPQTQCGQCGHPGCKPYAQAIAQGEAINRCPPGGQATIDALAKLRGQESLPLDASHGTESEQRKVAFIREAECIGCTKCIAACPVDAIVGAARFMHTVITSECTGCDLCVAPCPVDCIEMRPLDTGPQTWHWPKPAALPPSIIATDRA